MKILIKKSIARCLLYSTGLQEKVFFEISDQRVSSVNLNLSNEI
jgi:hypothetical protein